MLVHHGMPDVGQNTHCYSEFMNQKLNDEINYFSKVKGQGYLGQIAVELYLTIPYKISHFRQTKTAVSVLRSPMYLFYNLLWQILSFILVLNFQILIS
jgi:hypothetical protein